MRFPDPAVSYASPGLRAGRTENEVAADIAACVPLLARHHPVQAEAAGHPCTGAQCEGPGAEEEGEEILVTGSLHDALAEGNGHRFERIGFVPPGATAAYRLLYG